MPPHFDNWLLESGRWEDSGRWDDSLIWDDVGEQLVAQVMSIATFGSVIVTNRPSTSNAYGTPFISTSNSVDLDH